MPNEEANAASSRVPENLSPRRHLGAAWQPVTFRGVAAFSQARLSRVFTIQLVVSLLFAASLLWCLNQAWSPTIVQAIRALPNTGQITSGRLNLAQTSPELLANNGFLALTLNSGESVSRASASDLRVHFRETHVFVCSLFGCAPFRYPAGFTLEFNRPDLESGLEAWRLTILSSIIVASMACLMTVWCLLAILFTVPAWLAAYFKDRELSLAGSWKLSAAAMSTPAMTLSLTLILYGSNWVTLLPLLIIWAAHVPLSFVYLYLSVVGLPTFSDREQARRNPFDKLRPKSVSPSGKGV